VGAAGVLAFVPPEGAFEVPAACLAAGVLLAADLLAPGVEFAAVPAGADGDAGDAELAAGAPGVDGLAAELSALGVDEPALGAGDAAAFVSDFEFDDDCLEDPPEQAAPSMARVLNRAT